MVAERGQTCNLTPSSFTPADAQRVAQLLDASDDDDLAQVAYATRATARASDPFADAPPPRDTFTSEEPPAWLDAVPAPYLGRADRARDGALAAYRQGAPAHGVGCLRLPRGLFRGA